MTRYSSFSKESCVKKWLDGISADEILSKPLRTILGLDTNDISLSDVDTFKATQSMYTHLNFEQQLVFSPEYFRPLEVIEGPPGTGKTSVIIALLDYIGTCIGVHTPHHYTLVISEKNRGVDAVAERLASTQYNKVLSFGSENMGDSTKKYLLENKLSHHSGVLELYEKIREMETQCEQKTRKLKRLLYNSVSKKVYKELTWRNIGFIQHTIIMSGLRHGTKLTKINNVLHEMNDLIKEMHKIHSEFPLKFEEARESYNEECVIILSTFGSLHQVQGFLKDVNSPSLSIIVDESSTLLSWQGFYLEHFVNEIGGSIKNMILVGDTCQLPPYWPDHDNPNQEKESFLDLAKEKCKYISFTKQYRLPLRIMKILNKEYYTDHHLLWVILVYVKMK